MIETAPTILALFMLAVSVALVWSHLIARRRTPVAERDQRERRYRTRQFRRRMLTSVMVGLLGVSLLAGRFVTAHDHPLAFVAFWSAVVLATLWICLSAVVDLLSTSQYAAGSRQARQIELNRLEGELKSYARRQCNGDTPDDV